MSKAERKIESLYWQISLEQHYAAKIRTENKRLMHALKVMSPVYLGWDANEGEIECCFFCSEWRESGKHSVDCEYVKLTESEEK